MDVVVDITETGGALRAAGLKVIDTILTSFTELVANHLMGFYELAAIHLSQQPPDLSEASVAIDALAGVVDTLPGRLGEAEATMRDALHQIRLAYVAVEKAMREAVADDGDEAENETEDEAGD